MMKRILAILIIIGLFAIPVSANPIDDLYGWIFGSAPREEIENITEDYISNPPLVENLSITNDSIVLFINSDNESAIVTTNDPDLTTGTTDNVVIVRSR